MLYRLSPYKQWFSEQEYCSILKEHVFILHNVEYGIPFPDASVDYFYSSHLIEHLFKEHAKKLWKETHRVLKKGGILRICVPDLEYALALYQKGDKQKALDYFFAKPKSGYFARHRYMYDFDLLKQLLQEAGFNNVERCSYRQGRLPDIDVLDNRTEQTLYVETSKQADD